MSGQLWAKIIGIVLLIGGILGLFMQPLFGFIGMNTAHAVVWLIVGAIYAWAGFASGPFEAVNKWLGVILILLGVVGFFALQSTLMLMTSNNIIHIVVGLISAWFGWKG